MDNDTLALGLTMAGLLVSATVWLTYRIAQIPLAVERRIREHERECEGYTPGSGARRRAADPPPCQ